jgi:hypothetical protein
MSILCSEIRVFSLRELFDRLPDFILDLPLASHFSAELLDSLLTCDLIDWRLIADLFVRILFAMHIRLLLSDSRFSHFAEFTSSSTGSISFNRVHLPIATSIF